jgi:hypothetical protein
MGGMWHGLGKKRCIEGFGAKTQYKCYLEEQGVYERIILKLIL